MMVGEQGLVVAYKKIKECSLTWKNINEVSSFKKVRKIEEAFVNQVVPSVARPQDFLMVA